jgi:hypothetical protein
MELFPSIMSKARTIQVITPYDRATRAHLRHCPYSHLLVRDILALFFCLFAFLNSI